MGIESRDWYRDWWRKKTNYQEKAKFRVPISEEGRATDKDHEKGSEYLDQSQGTRPPDVMGVALHWTLKLLVLLFVFVVIMAIRKLIR